MIRIEQVSRRFNDAAVLTDISLTVARGEAVGIVGRRGSGLTTLLSVIATLRPPSSGHIRIDDIDAVREPFVARAKLMFVGGPAAPFCSFRVGEYLRFLWSARCRGRIGGDALSIAADRSGLDPSRRVESLSADDWRRLSLAAALMVQPEVLLLDEPFSNLECDRCRAWQQHVSEAIQLGATTLMTGADEAILGPVCHRLIGLDRGRLVGAPRGLPDASVRVALGAP